MPARVLIGIVTRNRAEILPKAIASALAQQYPLKKVAVVDDKSTDSTPTLAGSHPQVEWERFERNRGYVAARNHLMSKEGYDYYLSLDDDAWFLQGDEMTLAVDYLEKNPHAGAVAFHILSPDRPMPSERGAPCEVQTFIGCGHVLRKSALDRVGLYAPNPSSYGGEEKDLSIRLMDAGYRVMLLPGVHVWHDKTPLQRVESWQHRSGVCNDLAFAWRRFPLSVVWFALPWRMCRHLSFSIRHGLLSACLGGITDFCVATGRLSEARRPVAFGVFRHFIHLGRSGRD